MKPDTTSSGPAADAIERAHLKEPGDASHTIFRYAADPVFTGLLQRFWVPVWSLPAGGTAPQKVLQYPVCLIVVAQDYARFYGVVSGLSTTTLTGEGWAVGVMCAPAAGLLITRTPVAAFTDRYVPVTEVLGEHGDRLTRQVRAAMAADPQAESAHRQAISAYGQALEPFLPVDPEGVMVNQVVEFVEGRSDVTRVAQVCEHVGLSERSLQRLVHRRVGLTPKWLIQRRRLQEAAERLRAHPRSLAEVAAVLGYADQPHFVRDFSSVTGMTPGQFASLHNRGE